MMLLRSSPFSPFGRKVKMAAKIAGVFDRMTVATSDTNDPNDPLRADNPLGKIPVLIAEDGRAIYDSRVIVEYIDMLAGGGVILPNGSRRIEAQVVHALADGIMDASILLRYELAMREPSERSAKWVAHQEGKVARGLAALEASPPPTGDTTIAGIAVACALGYRDIRFEGTWRAGHPRLAAWLTDYAAKVPSLDATKPA